MTTAATGQIAAVLRTLPAEEVSLRLGGRERVYGGASLIAYARAAGILDAAVAAEHGYFVVEASDGARASVALAEVSPKPILLATTQDGEALRVGVRLVVPREGTRSLLGVTDVAFRVATAGTVSTADGSVTVEGEIRRPGRYDVVSREPSAASGERAGDASGASGALGASGVPLHDVLADAGMFTMTDGEQLAPQVVVVTGEDGRHAVLAASEVGPEDAQAPALLVPAGDGTVTLVVPSDRTEARTVARVCSVALRTG